jgi:ketosteroid isomerase-like protein
VTQESPQASDLARLLTLNLDLGEHERRGPDGAAFFERVLDDKLCFRRISGATIGKDEFLAGLADPQNTSEVLTTKVRQVQVLDDQAFVEAWVYLRGTRGGDPVDGWTRNLRLFEQKDGDWRCVMWFNKKLPEPPAA